jgi:hypothetical protein
MATTFITLVNDTLRRLNEVELTSTDFPTATGFRALVKDAVNASLQEISQKEFEFPFNHTTGTLTLVAGTSQYSLATDLKVADWDSFRINYDSTNNFSARVLKLLNYDSYNRRYFERDSEAEAGDRDQPIYVYRTLDTKAGFTPIPDAAYSVSYDYFAYATDLSASTDALYHCFIFRDNSQQAGIAKAKFDEGIERMRTLLINRFVDVRDTRVNRLLNVPHGNA